MDNNHFNHGFYWSRSFSDRVRGMKETALGLVWKKRREQKLQEIEARNICQWLFAAGFPQYVQMFQERCCPIDLGQVERDHQFLDALSLQLLVGQIKLLNHLSSQKITISLSRQELGGGSDIEDDQALSDQWTCQMENGRWTHKFLPKTKIMSNNHSKLSCSSSFDSALADSPKTSSAGNRSTPSSISGPVPIVTKNRSSSLKGFKRASFPFRHRSRTPLSRGSSASDSEPSSSDGSPMSASWNGPDRARSRSFRNLFRRSDSSSHRSRKAATVAAAATHGRPPPSAPSTGRLEIGDPVFVRTPEADEKMDRLRCVDINSPSLLVQQQSMDGRISDIPPSFGVASEDNIALNNNCGSSCDTTCVATGRRHAAVVEPRRAVSESFGDSMMHLNRWSNHCSYKCKSISNQNSETLSCSCKLDENSSLTKSRATHLASLQEKSLEIVDKNVEEWNNVDHRRSFYDNLSSTFGDDVPSNPQLELDLILVEIYRNIDSLNETLQGVGISQSLEADSNSVFEDEPKADDVTEKVPFPSHNNVNNHVSKLVVELDNGNLVTSERNEKQSGTKCDIISGHGPALTTNIHGKNTTTDDNVMENDEGIPNCFDCEFATHISSSIPNSDERVAETKRDFDGGTELGCYVSSDPGLENGGCQRLRWDSFSRDHLSTFTEECGNLSGMTAGQMALLYKLNLIRLTSIMEKYVPSVPLSSYWIRSKPVNHDQLLSGVFGRSLLSNLRQTGQPLPVWIIYAMQRIRRSAAEAIGIFRKSGVRSRIQQLRDQIDTDPDCIDFESLQVYDVADILKLYFRELPDCLLTRPLSQIFISIFRNVPSELRLDGLRSAIVLLPDENRDVLQCLLFFLMDLSQFASKNQMTASNLAICFAPSLFHVYGLRETSPSPASPQPRGHKLSPATGQKELHEQQAAQECLTYMIIKAKELFSAPSEFLTQCCHLQLDYIPPIHPFDQTSQELYADYLKQAVDDTLQDLSDNFKGWAAPECFNGIELSYKKTDGALRMWMCRVNLMSPPPGVLTRVRSERHLWDNDLVKGYIVDQLDSNMDVFRYVISSMIPQPPRAFNVLRLWQTSLPSNGCILVSTSIDHMEKKKPGDVAGLVLTSRYLVESCGEQKSRLTFISQVDLRGYTPHWYRKVYGHLCVNMMAKLRDSLNVDRETRA